MASQRPTSNKRSSRKASSGGQNAGRAAELARTVKSLRAELRKAEQLAEGREDADQRIFGLNLKVATLESRERDLNETIVSQREQIGRLETEGEALRTELEREGERLAALERRETELQELHRAGGEKAAGLKAERALIKGELQRERETATELRQRERELEGRVGGVREQVARLEAQRGALERELVTERERHGAEVEERGRELGSRLREHREAAAKLAAVRDSLQQELDTERRLSAGLRERERELGGHADALRSERDSLKLEISELEDATERARRLEEELAGAAAERNGLQGKLAERRKELAERQQELAGLGEKLEEQETRVADLRERVGDAERELAQKDLALSDAERRGRELEAELRRELAAAEQRGDEFLDKLEELYGSRTYRLMQGSWRFRAKLRHPLRPVPKRRALDTGRPAERKVAEATPQTPPAEISTAAPAVPAEPAAPAPAVVADAERDRWLSKAAAAPSSVRELRLAGVLDEMSAACLAPDCDLLRLDAERWQQGLDAHQPHLLLVESAWQANGGSWQYQVASYTHPDYIGLPKLKELVAACRQRGIPTVFWNKEDPVHFERFQEAAALFDHVLTTDANCIGRYEELEREGTASVEALQFAAQPRIHNPVSAPAERDDSPVFAGAYYRDRHLDRQHSLELLLDAALPLELVIYDRRFGTEDEAFGFPERFQDRIRGRLSYEEMVRAYKSHKVFLNVNSVTDSPTMFSRRVFELLACETAVVSTESRGVAETLGDLVPMVTTPKQATEALERLLTDDEYRRDFVRRGRRRVMAEHTYRHRLAQIGQAVGYDVAAYPGEEVAALALVDDVEQARQIRALMAEVSAQEKLPAEVLIGSHTAMAGDLQELADTGQEIRVRVVQQDPGAGRSERFRELAALAVSPWVGILHPAHSYGEHHLADLISATRYAEAEVIGNACFEVSGESGELNPELENRFVDSVHPHSALAGRELVAARGWPDQGPEAWGSLQGWFRDGIRFYSADAGNFRADEALAPAARGAHAASEQGPGT